MFLKEDTYKYLSSWAGLHSGLSQSLDWILNGSSCRKSLKTMVCTMVPFKGILYSFTTLIFATRLQICLPDISDEQF